MKYTDEDNNENIVSVDVIYVYDVTSDKYSINNDLKLISVGKDLNDEVLNNIYRFTWYEFV